MATVTAPVPATIGSFATANATRVKRKRLVVNVTGMEKTGKNALLFSAPDPIAFVNLDRGEEGVIEKYVEGRVPGVKRKVIMPAEYKVVIPPGADKTAIAVACNTVWMKLKQDIKLAVESPHIRTIGVDTESDTWELLRRSRFGDLSASPLAYPVVNAEYRAVWEDIFSSDKNLILLRRMKAEWKNMPDPRNPGKEKGEPTGRMKPAGFNDIPYIVQVNVQTHYYERDTVNEDGAFSAGFSIKIINCRQNPDVNGLILGGDTNVINFKMLGMLVFPNSSESDWE